MKLKVIGGYHDGRTVHVRDGIKVGEAWNIDEDIPKRHYNFDTTPHDSVRFHSYVVTRKVEVHNGHRQEWLVLWQPDEH